MNGITRRSAIEELHSLLLEKYTGTATLREPGHFDTASLEVYRLKANLDGSVTITVVGHGSYISSPMDAASWLRRLGGTP
jgi:hypothetical protein